MTKPLALRLMPYLCLMCFGCSDLGDFRTGPDEVFRGAVVGYAPRDAGTDLAPGLFLLHGFASDTRLDLTFDPEAAAAGVGAVGTLETYGCEVPDTRNCPSQLRTPGPLSETELRAIPGLAADMLSRYDFPGGDRTRNFIMHAPFQTEAHQRNATVFLSLMRDGSMQARVIAPEVAVDADLTLAALFGVFPLTRTKR